MPTAQDTTYLIEVMPGETTQDFLSRDVDLLVSQIKENLRLSGLKAKSNVVHRNRATPYRIPSHSSWADPNGCDICAAQNRTEKLNGVQLQQEHDQQLHHQPELRQQVHYRQQQQQQCCHRYNHHHHRHRHRRHHHHHHHHHHNCSNNDREDDPYEFLQELLREGGLIKEAVKRLQANIDELERLENDQLEEDEDDEEDDDEEEEEEEDVLEDGMVLNGAKERSRLYRRKPYFYDSEDEPSVYESVDL
ncbi:lateral signaling target protein 2 homolog [Vespa velutina]|uniref:lateral signaling target protein 2 homolog n=1 Tax=Vespa velutina TaxID=202808 RepID=UPI001FB43E2C|nr:lateral signaling target protein 2 homolog [Vespa velutina]